MSTLYSHEARENAAPTARLYACVLLVSAATLLFEIALTRIFAVTQGYHFAFLAISLALLGFGASGTALAIVPALALRDIRPVVAGAGLLFAVTSTGGLYLTNVLPFDAYTLLWEPSQLAYLALYYLALAVPFFFAGSIVGACLAKHPSRAGVLYGSNLVGAGIGCLLSVVFPLIVGAAGSVVVAGVIALAGAAAMAGRELRRPAWLVPGLLAVAAVAAAVVLGVTELRLSPYKAVSQALRHEGAVKAWSRWNAFSLVEVIESGSIHAAPGLSFAYQGSLPPQTALAVDGDNLSPMSAVPPERADFTEYLPTSLVYRLSKHVRPELVEGPAQSLTKGQSSANTDSLQVASKRPRTLVIEPGGGLDVLTALRNGAESVTAVISNPLVVEAVGEWFEDHAAGILGRPNVTVVDEGARSYLRRTDERFDVIQVSLADSFRPVLAGAYGVSENYLYTVEAFESYYRRLAPGGFLSVTRWAQTPPSEGVRVVSVAVEALERLGVEPGDHMAVIRGLQTITLIVKRSPLDGADIDGVRGFADGLQYDLVYHPGIAASDLNRFSVHPTPAYHDTVAAILDADGREELYAGYSHDISPVRDDRPFYFHLFRWSQTPEILGSLGRTFQPFGGAGFLIVLGSLVVAVVAAGSFILLPLLFRRDMPTDGGLQAGAVGRLWPFVYFAGLGLGFLWVEIPLLQRFILYLDQPTYAFATVLFGVLVWSGVGSLASDRLQVPMGVAVSAVAALSVLYAFGLPLLFDATLGLPLVGRLALSVALLAPLGTAMGVPFPRAIRMLGQQAPTLVPWAWAVNGSASVVSAILATVLALSFGFTWVILGGAAAYITAAAAAHVWQRRTRTRSP